MDEKGVYFKGLTDGCYGLFVVKPEACERRPGCIVVAQEGDYTGRLDFYGNRLYEEIQWIYGNRLKFIGKEFSPLLHRTLVKYEIEYGEGDIVLAVPATGEELDFEIYITEAYPDSGGSLCLALEQEL